MKLIHKLSILLVVFMLSACELTELDTLDNPNAVTPDNVELSLIFNAVQLDFKDFFHWASDRTMTVVRMRAMTGGNNYNNAFGPTTFNVNWNIAYSDLLPDLDKLIEIGNDPDNPLLIYSATAKTMKAYMFMTLVDMFGNIPFSQAGQGVAVPSPIADQGDAVYSSALGLLDEAADEFARNTVSIGNNDLFYDGDATKWLALVNSLRLKYYITTRLVDGGAIAAINGLRANVIADASGDFQFQYGTNRNEPNARHPFYNNHYELDGNEYLSNYFMWSLLEEKGTTDPRLRYYFYRQDLDTTDEDDFTLDCPALPRPLHYTGPYPWCIASENGYWGRDHGNNDGIPPDGDKKTCYGVYPVGGKFDADNGAAVKNNGIDGALGGGVGPIMLSSFVQFMLAEAALNGAEGDASVHLENGMRQSIAKAISFGALDPAYDDSFEPTAADIDAYVTLVMDNFAAASDAGKRDIVAKEYHIALWGNGVEAYNMYRRTGLPSGMQPTREEVSGDFPRLMFYPADYVNLNAEASQRDIKEQVFWDNNPAGFIN
ncbi:MAG: SusD/RagB family nutrient-binding outer membrane lipoprotein [Bacteroidota bacterium]